MRNGWQQNTWTAPWLGKKEEITQLLADIHIIWNPANPKLFLGGLSVSDENGYNSSLVVTCQLVLHDVSGRNNVYTVVDCCHELTKYQHSHDQYFSKDGKSIIAIFNDYFRQKELGFVQNRQSNSYTAKSNTQFRLQLDERVNVEAPYEDFANEGVCYEHWQKWANFMFELYPEVNCVFSENLQIDLDSDTKLNSAIFLSFAQELTDEVKRRDIARRCWKFLSMYSHHEFAPQIYRNVTRQASRAAISQVMARNMSHNIGSHVMNHLTKVSDIYSLMKFKDGNIGAASTFRDQVMAGRENYGNIFAFYSPSAYIPKILSAESSDYNSFNLVARFNAYLKYRMGYLGDVTFGTPMMQTSKKISDLYRDFERNLLLLDNISGLGTNFPYTVNFTVHNSLVCDGSGPASGDREIAVPNDLLGCQAFYNIIENVIRNTAKYANLVEERPVNFTVDFNEATVCDGYRSEIDDPDTLYGVEIYDDIDLNGRTVVEFSDDDYKKYEDGGGTKEKSEMTFADVLVFGQNRLLNDSVLDQNMQLRTKGLGLLEMEASAAYLRRLPDITDIESDSYKVLYNDHHFTTSREVDQDGKHTDVTRLNILKAFVKHDGNKEYLGYRFFVLKPRVAVVISNERIESASDLKKHGILILNTTQFKERLTKSPLNHEFLVCDKALEDNCELLGLFKEHDTSLPMRRIRVNVSDWIRANSEIEKLIIDLWNRWFDKIRCGKFEVDSLENVKFHSDDSPITSQDNQCKFVIQFLNHATEFSKEEFDSLKTEPNYYLEPLSSFGQEKLPNYEVNHIRDYPSHIDHDIETKIRLFEAATTPIIVIDERIQNYAKESSEGARNREIFESIGVSVPADKKSDPTSGFDLDSSDYKGIKKKIEKFLEEHLPSDDTPEVLKPFLLLHYGVIERSYKAVSGNWVEQVNTKLEEWGTRSKIVITSGRGKPKELPGNVRFVHLSPILNVFTEIRSKYLMTNLLYSARRAS